jgi:hypothetical protein
VNSMLALLASVTAIIATSSMICAGILQLSLWTTHEFIARPSGG